jgi:hypothetical protein
VKTFKLSHDPRFAEKLEAVVNLYLHPPPDAILLAVDEKCQIQALERTQPGLPWKKGRCGTRTHDYKRPGTTTLFAAMNTQDGTGIDVCMPKHCDLGVDQVPATPSSAYARSTNLERHSSVTAPEQDIERFRTPLAKIKRPYQRLEDEG